MKWETTLNKMLMGTYQTKQNKSSEECMQDIQIESGCMSVSKLCPETTCGPMYVKEDLRTPNEERMTHLLSHSQKQLQGRTKDSVILVLEPIHV